MAARAHNPAVSPEQYRLAQAVLSGSVKGPSHMTVKVAREIVDSTPAHLRSEWSQNPVDGWEYFDSKKARDVMARLHEGKGHRVEVEHSVFGYREGGGKKWRVRVVRATNPKQASDDMYESFHGEPSDETIEIEREEHYHSHLSALGELVELKVKLVGGGKAVIGFESTEDSDAVPNPFWSSARSTASKISGSVLSRLKRAAASRKERAKWIPYATTDSEMRAQAKAGYLEAHDVSAKVERRKTGGVFSRKYKFEVLVDRDQLREMFKRSAGEKRASRGTRSGGSKPAGAYKGYQIREVEGGFAVPKLDPDGVFSSKADAKEFIDYSKMGAKVKNNPGGPLDEHAAKELELYVENDADLYRQQYTPINKNLVTKMARGVYNHAGAVKLFGYLMESGAKKYAKEYSEGKDWHQIFSPATRKHVAEIYASHFETEAKLGNYDNLLPKKYAGWREKNPGPFSEAGKLITKGRRAVSRPMDQFLGAAGRVGGYLDSQIGRALNPPKNKTKLDLILDRVVAGEREVTFDVRDGYTQEQIDRIIRTARSRGLDASSDGKFILVRDLRRRNPESNDTGPVILTSNEEGTQLFITGGDQSLDLSALEITGAEADKELIRIGDITHIVYHARKKFGNKTEEYDYVHKMGEDGGELPVLNYDRINQQLHLSGGSYVIKRPLGETSPGIEN